MKYKNHIATTDSITVMTDEGSFQVLGGTPVFTKIRDLLEAHDWNGVSKLINVPQRLRAYSGGKFIVIDGLIHFNNEPLPNALSTRIMDFLDNDLDCLPLVKFWDNLRKNPSEDSKKDLYAFLEHNNIPITADGCFIGYKSVDDKYQSKHAGVWVKNGKDWTLDNEQSYDHTPGKSVSMPREKVDPDRNNTCSSGLHIAAWSYATTQMGGGRIVECKIHPKDVVTVPPDYNQEKMRTCGYTVVRDVSKPFEKPLYEHDDSFESEGGQKAADIYEDDSVVEDAKKSPTKTRDEATEQVLTVDMMGRVRIPAALIKAAGFEAGDEVSVNIDKEVKVIAITKEDAESDFYYTIDEYCNVRIGKSAFADAGLGRRKTIIARVVGTTIFLT